MRGRPYMPMTRLLLKVGTNTSWRKRR